MSSDCRLPLDSNGTKHERLATVILLAVNFFSKSSFLNTGETRRLQNL